MGCWKQDGEKSPVYRFVVWDKKPAIGTHADSLTHTHREYTEGLQRHRAKRKRQVGAKKQLKELKSLRRKGTCVE